MKTMKWIKFTDDNGGRRVFGTDPVEGGVFYQRADGTWNRITSPKVKINFTTTRNFLDYIEDRYHMSVKGFHPTEDRGGWG